MAAGKDEKQYVYTELSQTFKAVEHCCGTVLSQVLIPYDVTFTQCEILLYLYRQPERKVNTHDLSCALQMESYALSDTLKKMKQKGYIRYFNKAGSRTEKQVTLTVKAMDIKKPVTERFRDMEGILYAHLTEPECEYAKQILNKMLRNMQEFIKEERCDETNTGMSASI